MRQGIWSALPACLLFTFLSSAARAYVNGQPADLVIGQPNMTSNAMGTSINAFNNPGGICSDGTRLFVADQLNNRVLIYNSIPALVANNAPADVVVGQPNMSTVSANSVNGPWGVYSDGIRLLVADRFNNRVLIYHSIPTANNAAADVVVGQPNMTSSTSGVTANTLYGPFGVWCAGAKLLVADTGNNRVLIYNTIPASSNAAADVVVGQMNMTSNVFSSSVISAATLYVPMGVYSDGTRLLVADSANQRVLIYNTVPGYSYTMADTVIGQPNMTTRLSGTSANTLFFPAAVYGDGSRLLVADDLNSRVLIYNTVPTSNNPAADAVVGQPNMTSGGSGAGANNLGGPSGVYSDGTRLLVADNPNNRVLIYYYAYPFAAVFPNYSLSGKSLQVIGAGFYGTPVAKLTRSGLPDITSTGAVPYNAYNYSYTFDLTNAAPNCYDLAVTAGTCPRQLKQAFTVLSPLASPIVWKVNDLGAVNTVTAIGNYCGLDIGDAAQTSTQQLYVANQDQSLYQLIKSTYGWSTPSALPQESGAAFSRVLLADGNGDGNWELYGASANNHVYEFKNNWIATDLGAGPGKILGLARLDADHDGISEIYAVSDNGHISQFWKSGGSWLEADITNANFPSTPGNALASGDGNNDGAPELYSVNASNIYQYAFTGAAWQVSLIGAAQDTVYGVAVGDGHNDGQQEVFAASKYGYIYQCQWGTTWTCQPIGNHGGGAMYAVAVSDADNDGANEVYAACGDGHVYAYKYQSGNWATLDLGNAGTPLFALAVGDADNDHQFEVYALGQNNHVYQFKAGSLAAATPSPTPVTTPFAAIPQNYFKIFHSQINPSHGEQARIRWTQPQAGPVSIKIYNLLGDKVITLQEGGGFSAGEYHEADWNGRTQKGAVAGSGIFIVVFTSPGSEARGKIAVIK